MTQLADVIELGSEDEARRLWKGALEARGSAADDLVALCESLDLGLHAAEVVAIQLLQPIKENFPATIEIQLSLPTPEVDPHRDGIAEPNVIEFTDIIDLLSDQDLDCVSPSMHRGWEDRRFSCRRSRAAAQKAIGVSLSAEDQRELLVISAYRNRLFRYPPPIRIVPAQIHSGFERLERLMDALMRAAGWTGGS